MYKKIIVLNIVFFFFLSLSQGQSVTDEHKFEVGGQITTVQLQTLEATATTFTGSTFTFDQFGKTVSGFGGRFGYNINKNISIEAEGNFFPEDLFGNEEGGQKTQFFAGVKAGVRNNRVGVFAKARPGAMTFKELSSFNNCNAGGLGVSCRTSGQTNFALDVGGVVEFYPSSRTIIRVDLGDTIVRYRGNDGGGGFASTVVIRPATKHNFQASIGFGFRF
jgi:hypothetical protein